MKQIFTFFGVILFGSISMAQVFQSDLSSWNAGDPTDWMGTKTNIGSSNVNEITTGAVYGTSGAQLIYTGTTSHKRFTTQAVTVTGGTTYEVKMWVLATSGKIRTSHYDITNASYGTYNSYIDLSTASAGSLVEISQIITVDATCTSTEFILSIQNSTALGVALDSVSIAEVVLQAVPHTIYDIQYSTLSSFDSPLKDSVVITSGVVTALRSGDGYWMQDGNGAWNGIYVKDNSNTPAIGDSITIEGAVGEDFNATQIQNLADYTLQSSPSQTITPAVITSLDAQTKEDYEGVLIKIENGTCTNDDAGFGQWTINNSSVAGDSVLVDDDLFAFTPTLNTDYHVTGIAHYSYGDRKVLPRDAADIVEATTQGIVENTNSFSVYPNPASEFIILNGVNNGQVNIYALNGKLVLSSFVNESTNLDISNLSSGLYTLEVVENNAKSVSKLIVR